MMKIGLTGNRYSGKDYIGKLFNKIHVPVFEADVVLRFIINNDYTINKEIRDKLSEYYGSSSSFIDVSKITSKKGIEIILDSAEYNLFKAYEFFNEKNRNSIYTIFKSSILFERGWNEKMDYNINVFSPKLLRMQRWNDMTNKSIKDLQYLLSNEIPGVEKSKLSNFVINAYKNYNTFKAVNEIDEFIVDEYLKLRQTIRV